MPNQIVLQIWSCHHKNWSSHEILFRRNTKNDHWIELCILL